ncbi:MAG: right-handed parallel beta-helix repeat-containing protein [Acidobacteria bacterium]|nr:right-handed parallel beta-helix repeat-containing protein [Acidobacteriota bacterium]
MSKTDLSRRKFLSRSALALPVAAAIPAAMEVTSMTAEAASVRQDIPSRTLPTRAIGTTTVTVSGLPTDETSDCSAIIQAAINSLPTTGTNKGGTVIIPRTSTGGTGKNRCIYRLNCQAYTDGTASWGLLMKSNVRLEFRPGVVLQALTINSNPSNLTKRAYMVYAHEINDVEIVNAWFVGERQTHIYSGLGTGTDEWCHGMQVLGVDGMTIMGTTVSDCTGDGVCVGNMGSTGSSDIIIFNSILTTNRRQALSITQGDGIYCYDSEFSNTYGTLPMDGIDIEPQGSASVNNVVIDNCVIRGNQGNGIECNLQGTSLTNLTISNSMVQNNFYNGFWTHMGSGGTVDTGSVHGNAFYQNGNYGLVLSDLTTNYTVGDPSANGSLSNNFSNNKTTTGDITYPHTNQTNTKGVPAGSNQISVGTNTQLPSSGTVINYNSYFTH